MKTDGETLAALIGAGAAALATITGLISMWRSSPGRAYNRLAQLLTIRGQIPDTLPDVQQAVDHHISLIAKPLGPPLPGSTADINLGSSAVRAHISRSGA